MSKRFVGAVVATAAGYGAGLLGLVVGWYLGNGISLVLDLKSTSDSMIPISPVALLLAGVAGLVAMILAVAWMSSLVGGGAWPWLGTCLGTVAGLVIWGVVSSSRGEIGSGLVALPPAAAIVAWLLPSRGPPAAERDAFPRT